MTRPFCTRTHGSDDHPDLTTHAPRAARVSCTPTKSVWADRAMDDRKQTSRSLFYSTVEKTAEDGTIEKYLGYSYFSLPLRCSGEQRQRVHRGRPDKDPDRMTLETPVACRLILLCSLLVQYAFMAVRVGCSVRIQS